MNQTQDKEDKKRLLYRFDPLSLFLKGEFLEKDLLQKSIPFISYIVLLGVLYIANGYIANNGIIEEKKIKKEVRDLKSEYVTIKSKLMYMSKQSKLLEIIRENDIELEESLIPPRKIEVKKSIYKELNRNYK